jgi:DNA processing protein
MDEMLSAAVVLTALELLPGEPSDLTALLRSEVDRRALLGPGYPDASQSAGGLSPLAEYLVRVVDPSRVEAWVEVIERGSRECRYRPLIVGDRGYPRRLDRIWDAPPLLFRSIDAGWPAGAQPDVDPEGPTVGIIGGREVSTSVLHATEAVAAAVATQGYRVVSGLASGVDTAAHAATLKVGGLTTAVLGTGIDHVFPTENAALARTIAGQGVLVSQFAPPAPRTGTTFLRRNCVIAALSDVSLIMNGRARSGSRHEVEQAVRYDRPVLMWAPALHREAWATALLDTGEASFVDSVEAVLAALP